MGKPGQLHCASVLPGWPRCSTTVWPCRARHSSRRWPRIRCAANSSSAFAANTVGPHALERSSQWLPLFHSAEPSCGCRPALAEQSAPTRPPRASCNDRPCTDRSGCMMLAFGRQWSLQIHSNSGSIGFGSLPDVVGVEALDLVEAERFHRVVPVPRDHGERHTHRRPGEDQHPRVCEPARVG